MRSTLLVAWVLPFVYSVIAASVLAIDYGTDTFKASLVKPGIPFDVVLNKDSKRKTPSLVTLRGDDRAFGSEAASLATRFPQDTFPSIKLLLGHPSNHSQALLHQSLFLPSLATTSRASSSISSSKATYEVEELLAMQLAYAKEIAEETAGESIRDVIVTVPSWFGTGERQAVLDAIELSGLRSLGLINDGTAAAVNFAMTRTFPPTPSYHLIYDFGAGSLRCTAVSLRSTLLPDPLSLAAKPDLKNVTSLTVHGLGFDIQVGGLVFDGIIRDLMLDHYASQDKVGPSIVNDRRAMAKLLREAGRIKHVLSANSESVARIEGLVDDVDFRTIISREQFEQTAAARGLLPRFVAPIAQALGSANLTLDQIESVIMVGGSSRVPMVESAVRGAVGAERLAKNVNAEEAAVMGAALYGAATARGFRTKDIRVQDISPYAVDVAYDADPFSNENGPRSIITHLFPSMAKVGTKKTISFKKSQDFDLQFSYFDSELRAMAELPHRIAQSSLAGVSAAYANLTNDAIANATIKVTIELDNNGLVNVDRASVELEPEAPAGPSTFNDRFKDLLGKFSSVKAEAVNPTTKEANSAPSAEDPPNVEAESIDNLAKVEEMLRFKTLYNSSIELEVKSQALGHHPLTSGEMSDARKRLREGKAAEIRRLARAEAQNVLEAYIYRVRDLVAQATFIDVSLASERNAITERTAEASDWLYNEGDAASTKDLKTKKGDLEYVFHRLAISHLREDLSADQPPELRKLVKHILSRSLEATQRPSAISALESTITKANTFVTAARHNITMAEKAGDQPKHTSTELDGLQQLIQDAAKWLQDLLKDQAKLKTTDDPVLKLAEMEKRGNSINAEVTKLYRKKVPRRKKPAEEPAQGPEVHGRVKDEL